MTETVEKKVLFEPFPKQQEFLDACLSGEYSFVLFGGAIRGGKTMALLALFTLLSRFYPGSRWAIVRKDLPTIKTNLYPSWEKIKPNSFIVTDASDSNQQTVTFKNGSKIIFFPESHSTDKDKNRWKGLEVNGVGFEEINECYEASFFKAFERAGTYIIPNLPVQPIPIVVGTCNPTNGWVKDRIYTPNKEGTLRKGWKYIQSRIYDNIPLLTQQPNYLQSLKDNLNHYEYEVFVEGNWEVQLKTGGEFLRSFDLQKHIKETRFDRDNTVHISIDSNVYPHIAITAWQMSRDEAYRWQVKQVGEVPCSDPDNTASRAGKKLLQFLRDNNYHSRVFLYGDKSTKSRNNIDEEKRSFFQILCEQLIKAGYVIEDKMPSSMPPVAGVADFVNACLAGEVSEINIEIGQHCKESINDYIETKSDKDGTMLKVRVQHPTIKGLTYEKNGHLTDTFKDFMVQAFNDEFRKYQNSKQQITGIKSIANAFR